MLLRRDVRVVLPVHPDSNGSMTLFWRKGVAPRETWWPTSWTSYLDYFTRAWWCGTGATRHRICRVGSLMGPSSRRAAEWVQTPPRGQRGSGRRGFRYYEQVTSTGKLSEGAVPVLVFSSACCAGLMLALFLMAALRARDGWYACIAARRGARSAFVIRQAALIPVV